MPDPAMIDQQPFWAATAALLAGGLLWLWRGFSLGVKIGALTQGIDDSRREQRADTERIEARLVRMEKRMDGHIDGDKK